MRTISADYAALLAAPGGTQRRFRVRIKDSGGTLRDLTSYAGPDMVISASWNETVDNNGHDATIEVARNMEALSLSPFMTGSALNRGFAWPGSFAPLVELNREVVIEWAIAAAGVDVATWVEGFRGFVDSIDPGAWKMKLTARGQYAPILDTFIEEERVYAHAAPADPDATKGLFIWKKSRAGYTVGGQLVMPSEAKRNGHFYKVSAITTGISGTTEPTWPTGAGATVVDGGVTFQEAGLTTTSTGTAVETVMQQLLNDNGLGAVTLTTPVSPAWLIRWYQQSRMPVWQALRALSDQIGWDLRYKWNTGGGAFRLELNAVDRAKATPDRTFGPGERYTINRLQVKLDGIRNKLRVIFLNSQVLDSKGNPTRDYVDRNDATSITKYGTRYMEVSESSTSNIDSQTEAQTFADAMIGDLKNPVAEQECDVPFFPFVELGDLYRFSADGVHYDVDQDLAVVAYTHSFSSGKSPKARTVLTCRGKPSGGYIKWLSQEAGRNSESHALEPNNAASITLAAADVVGGTKLTAAAVYSKMALPKGYEFHVSKTPGFTPDANSLVQSGHADEVTLGNLLPGQSYEALILPFHYNAQKIVQGLPSERLSFTAGRASAGHLKELMALGDYPINAGFETRVDASGFPDHWETNGVGALGGAYAVMEDANGVSGGRYMKIVGDGSTQPAMVSAQIPIINEAGASSETARYGGMFRLRCWVKNDNGNSAGGTLTLAVGLVDYTGVKGAGFLQATSTTVASDSKKNHWQLVELFFNMNTVMGGAANSAFNAYVFFSTSLHAQTYYVDEMRLQYLGTPWYEVGDTTKFTDNYEAIPAFTSGWVNYGGNYATAAFRRDQHGRIHLKGIIKDGTIGAAAFTLPPGWRIHEQAAAPKYLYVPSVSNNAFGVVEVQTPGGVVPQVGNAAFFTLDGMHFERF